MHSRYGAVVGVACNGVQAHSKSSMHNFMDIIGPCIPGIGTAIAGGLSERRGITIRRFIGTIAPQVFENPLQVRKMPVDKKNRGYLCLALHFCA